MKIAFYAPIKPPDHPIASGDRLIAQNLIKALELGGHTVTLASRFIAYSKREADTILAERKALALREADRVLEGLRHDPPDLFITYHPYCKAPDWIGPRATQGLLIPYITVEAARTGQGFENGGDRWKNWREEAQAGIMAADQHIALKPADRAYLTGLGVDTARIDLLKPFIDMDALEIGSLPHDWPEHWRPDIPLLACIGMMRPGKKTANYDILAKALAPLQGLPWTIAIVGDGPSREGIETEFAVFDPARIHFTGALPHKDVLAVLHKSDLMVWPGWREPIGMVYLEAQAVGTPVCALDSMGVSLTVDHGRTGMLAPEETAESLSEQLRLLLSQPTLRADLAANTKLHVQKHHSLPAAADHLSAILHKHG